MNKLREKFLQLKNVKQKTSYQEEQYDELAARMIADIHLMLDILVSNNFAHTYKIQRDIENNYND